MLWRMCGFGILLRNHPTMRRCCFGNLLDRVHKSESSCIVLMSITHSNLHLKLKAQLTNSSPSRCGCTSPSNHTTYDP